MWKDLKLDRKRCMLGSPLRRILAKAREKDHEMSAMTVTPNIGASSERCALSVEGVEKVFGSRGVVTQALRGVSFEVAKGEYVSVMGQSGSGKTTLLNCISTIDKPTSGRIVIDGEDMSLMSRKALARFRRDSLGFVFQDFNLLDTLNAYENIALALTIKKANPATINAQVKAIANKLGVADVLKKFPNQMSGGQKQRVAAARAIVSDPKLILADEPTGALDSHSANMLLEAFEMLNADLGATIVMVTHDAFAASFSNRVIFLRDGQIFNELYRGDLSRENFFMRIMEVVSFLGGSIAQAV